MDDKDEAIDEWSGWLMVACALPGHRRVLDDLIRCVVLMDAQQALAVMDVMAQKIEALTARIEALESLLRSLRMKECDWHDISAT